MSSCSLTLSIQLNTNRKSIHMIQMKHDILLKNEKKLMKYFLKACKSKFNLKKNTSNWRFFVMQTGEEITISNIHRILSVYYASTLKNGLSVLLSFGEDFIGKIVNNPFKRLNQKQILLSVFSDYNTENIHIEMIENIYHEILSFLPKIKEMEPLSKECNKRIHEMFKIMSSGKGKNKKGFNQIYRDCTRSIYCALRDECINNNNAKPNGLKTKYFQQENMKYIDGARKEVDDIFTKLLSIKPHLHSSSNLKIYVNTAYYSRQSKDEWPMFDINDERIKNIKQCIENACKLLNINQSEKDKDKKLLNIIIRQYRINDVLGFHTDRNEFIEPISGIILRNEYSAMHSLLFYQQGIKPYISKERPGFCWSLRDDARWNYKHGLAVPFNNNNNDNNNNNYDNKDIVRTSISFRWFKHNAKLPQYNHDNDLL